ncbi:MAG TPA: hypothetical protein VHW66_17130 [Stellaceae bacterium]|jgi:hypothetical protein|nr:hypothetical protein [Stellaceae bacterium]
MMRLFSRYRRRGAQRFGVGLAVLALCLRLATPAFAPEPVAVPAGPDLVALFGEHALCIAAARGEAPTEPAPPAQQHDHGLCCLFHANLGFAPPSAPPTPTLVALDAAVELLAPVPVLTSRAPAGAARARAPPPLA